MLLCSVACLWSCCVDGWRHNCGLFHPLPVYDNRGRERWAAFLSETELLPCDTASWIRSSCWQTPHLRFTSQCRAMAGQAAPPWYAWCVSLPFWAGLYYWLFHAGKPFANMDEKSFLIGENTCLADRMNHQGMLKFWHSHSFPGDLPLDLWPYYATCRWSDGGDWSLVCVR